MLFTVAMALALDTKKIPTQDIFIDDGETRSYPQLVEFAFVGGTRDGLPEEKASKRVSTAKAQAQIAADISNGVQEGRVGFVMLGGDIVTASSVAGWKAFTRDWVEVLSGSEPPEGGRLRTRVVPVAGAREAAGDDRYFGFGAAFPGVGADIGYNRVGTWYHFDFEVAGHTWRFLVVDSNKSSLGSRWDEQTAYIEKVAAEEEYDSLLLFMHHPLITLAPGQVSNEGEAPEELLQLVDGNSKVGALKAVFAGAPHATEVFLPRGKFGEIYINGGGGGAPADNTVRWGHADAAGFSDIKLETTFDFALLREFEKQAEARACSPTAMEHAKSEGSWKGFPGEYEASCMPTQGWWDVSLAGERLSLSFRIVQPDGTLRSIYTADYSGKKSGWTIGK